MHGTKYANDAMAGSPYLAGLTLESDESGDEVEVTGKRSVETAFSPISECSEVSTAYADFANKEDTPESPIRTESNSSPHKSSYLFNFNEPHREKITETIRRAKSMPLTLLDETDDYTFLELADLMPPVNRFTLRELELDEILSNAQLRHDLVFDPDLKFKPNTEQDPDAGEKLAEYWEELTGEVALGHLYRIPLLLAEIRSILVELLPNGLEIKDELFANIDVMLVAQQIEHGIMQPAPLVHYLAKLIKTNCAPIRDVLVDRMVTECESGNIVETLKLCFEIVEFMKLVFSINARITLITRYPD